MRIGYYARDNAFYLAWDEIARDRERFTEWINQARALQSRPRGIPRKLGGGRMSVDSSSANSYTPDEMMTIAAARLIQPGCVCFVGIGVPSAAANLARLTHAPDMVLIYESGAIGTHPNVLPLSIGDGELAETADAVVPLPEIFSYWLQAGRIDVGFLGAAQIDRFGNLNTTVIGGYGKPKTRLPGAGGAPEIALHAKTNLCGAEAVTAKLCRETGFLHECRLPQWKWRASTARHARCGSAGCDHRFGRAQASDRVAGAHSSRSL